jgi:hypothetical protein
VTAVRGRASGSEVSAWLKALLCSALLLSFIQQETTRIAPLLVIMAAFNSNTGTPPPQLNPWAFTLFISEIRIEQCVAAAKSKPGTFDNSYIQFEICPANQENPTGPKSLLECRRSCTGTVSLSESTAKDIVFYGHEVLLRNCSATWSRCKFFLCKNKTYATARDLTKLTEDNKIERKVLCWGECSMPWTQGPQFFTGSEELHFLDNKNNRQFAGRIVFKVQKTLDGAPLALDKVNNTATQQGQGQSAVPPPPMMPFGVPPSIPMINNINNIPSANNMAPMYSNLPSTATLAFNTHQYMNLQNGTGVATLPIGAPGTNPTNTAYNNMNVANLHNHVTMNGLNPMGFAIEGQPNLPATPHLFSGGQIPAAHQSAQNSSFSPPSYAAATEINNPLAILNASTHRKYLTTAPPPVAPRNHPLQQSGQISANNAGSIEGNGPLQLLHNMQSTQMSQLEQLQQQNQAMQRQLMVQQQQGGVRHQQQQPKSAIDQIYALDFSKRY